MSRKILKTVAPANVMPSKRAVRDFPLNKINMMTALNTSRVNPATELEVKKNSSDMDRLYLHQFRVTNDIRLSSFHFRVESCITRYKVDPRRRPLHFWNAGADNVPQLLRTFK